MAAPPLSELLVHTLKQEANRLHAQTFGLGRERCGNGDVLAALLRMERRGQDWRAAVGAAEIYLALERQALTPGGHQAIDRFLLEGCWRAWLGAPANDASRPIVPPAPSTLLDLMEREPGPPGASAPSLASNPTDLTARPGPIDQPGFDPDDPAFA